MNVSLVTADQTTHLKIVVVGLLASLAVLIVGISARPQVGAGAGVQIVRAGSLLMAADTPAAAIR